jgi:hypothetical protein
MRAEMGYNVVCENFMSMDAPSVALHVININGKLK